MSNSIPPSDRPSPPPRVWLVDDSRTHVAVAQQALAGEYEVESFLDGASVLEAIAQRGAPSLLILDWHMPGLSGLEVCSFIRQTKDAGELPVLMLTASVSQDNLVEAFDAGANDYVMKPFGTKELQARVAALLRAGTLHAQLREAKRMLQIEAHFREEFMGMLAHDLRQPLNTFNMANQLLSQLVVSARGTSLLAMQERATQRMTRMVRELLDFTKNRAQSGIPIARTELDLAALGSQLLAEIRVAHPDRDFELKVEGNCVGSWDADRIAQLCSNLLGNAVEHGAADSPILLSLTCEPTGAVVLRVSNRGTPIPPEQASAIFQPFRRGKNPKKKTEGVGLGLHIVAEIARAHGGEVSVQSNSEATVFEVTLPK